MDAEFYSEEVLQAKKYGELLKIAKLLGARCSNNSGRRLKMVKLIEVILETQSANCIAEDAAAVADALGGSRSDSISKGQMSTKESVQTEELLSDIQFPEISKPKDSGSADELLSDIQFPEECTGEAPKLQGSLGTAEEKSQVGSSKSKEKSKRRRTETFDVDKNATNNDTEGKRTDNKRRRTGTVDIEADVSNNTPARAKRRRTSTFEVLGQNSKGDLPSGDTNNDAAEENGQQLQELSKRMSEKLNQKVDFEKHKSRSRSSAENKTKDQAPLKIAGGSPINTRKPASKTPKTERKSMSKSINQTIARKSVTASVKKLSSVTPCSSKKELPASKLMKPLFTVGKGGKTPSVEEKEESKPLGSNIPRFVTFARRLKVPNFAKIHERAFQRMQALDDYVERKRKMSELTNSSSKKVKPTPSKEEVFRPAITTVENLNLNFAATAAAAASPARVAKLPLPKSVKSISKSEALQVSRKSTKSPKHAQAKTAASGARLKSPKVRTRKSPRSTQSAIKAPYVSESMHKNLSAKIVSPKIRSSALPKPLKENVKPARYSFASPATGKLKSASIAPNTPGSLHKRQEYDPKASLDKPLNYVPYKGTLKALNTADIRKAMSEKIPPILSNKDRRQHQQKILKGVRFNKRFELQMAKRGISLN